MTTVLARLCPTLAQAALGAAVLLVAACNQQQPAQEQAAATSADGSNRPGPDLTKINDQNVVEILTKYGQEHPQTEVLIKTDMGPVKVRLFKDTPLHRANFLLLANKGYLDQTVFYRIEKGFVVQGGNSDKRTISLGKYHLPPEIKPEYFHRRGAVGMARYDDEKNPGRLSSSHDFYFTVGKPMKAFQAQGVAGRKLTPEQVKAYTTEGGVPALDGQYTVFGEVVEGMDVVEKINQVPVDAYNWPLKDVGMKVEILK
ncbi:peptidylprolyl isomerase [Hymenobacter oligotrophus]|uniref:Peptidyl-prolyl cis-trans isomerase n=1 Tax=Hymenobacter oligotrophus TaxID=2319843 RepID=A0A3B7R752_9BACT|nr:peptidylprolyl isomerase [Hymenobacter oligotrophus]AYA37091.1 peptidylprolyl isomerase [Hymenobacter oligotrophus]